MLRFLKPRTTFRLTTFLALCILPASMFGATIFSEDFEGATPALGVTSAGQFSTINGTNVDILGTGQYGYECLAPESGNCVDLGGTNGNSQGNLVSTTIVIPAAGIYVLSFDLVGNSIVTNTTSTIITFGSYSQQIDLGFQDTTNGIISVAVSFAAPGTATLSFQDVTAGGGDNASLLDNVVITSGVPEPTSALLLGSALLAASLIRKRAAR